MSYRDCNYTVVDRILVVTDAVSGSVVWQGRPLRLPVEEVQGLPGGSRAIVLLDYTSGPDGPFANLLCVACDGELVWRAELPSGSSTEAYVSFDLTGDALLANSWTGHRVQLDIATGRMIQSAFTK